MNLNKTPPHYTSKAFLEKGEKIKQIIENILRYEVTTTSCKSSGPGGQNVNKRETKAILLFNVENSQYLSNEQKEKLKKIAGKKVNNEGILRITDQVGRGKEWNTENALEKFKNLLLLVLEEDKPRIPTKIPESVKRKGAQTKKFHSQLKESRKKNSLQDEE